MLGSQREIVPLQGDALLRYANVFKLIENLTQKRVHKRVGAPKEIM